MHWSSRVLLILSWVGSEIFLLSAQLALRSASWCRMAWAGMNDCSNLPHASHCPTGTSRSAWGCAFHSIWRASLFFFPSHPLTFHWPKQFHMAESRVRVGGDAVKTCGKGHVCKEGWRIGTIFAIYYIAPKGQSNHDCIITPYLM